MKSDKLLSQSPGILALGAIALLVLSGCDGGAEDPSPIDDVAAEVALEPPPAPQPDEVRPGAGAEPDDVPLVAPPVAKLVPPAGEPAFAVAEADPPEQPGATPAIPPIAANEPFLTTEMDGLIEGADIIAGRTYLQRCAGCHLVDPTTQGQGAAQLGPPLTDVVGRAIGGVEGFDYSPIFVVMRETGAEWSVARLDLFLADPVREVPGTTMSVDGVPSAQDRANIIAFLQEQVGLQRATTDDPDLLGRIAGADPDFGRALVARCSGCHRFEPDAVPLIGPNLYEIVDAAIGDAADFAYSQALQTLRADGVVWTYSLLESFLESPATAIPGTRMGFGGVADADERAAIIAYLRSLSADPRPIFATDEAVGVEQAGLNALEFAADQAELGRALYADVGCVECHRNNLRGEVDMTEEGFGFAPPLIGPNFEQNWYRSTVYDLFVFVRSRKPVDDPGALDDQDYADIIAYLLARNGFAPGGARLTSDRGVLESMGFYQ